MPLQVKTFFRVGLLGLVAAFLPAAGQFPVAAVAAGPFAELAGEQTDTLIEKSPGSAVDDLAAVAPPRPVHLAALVARTIDDQAHVYGDRECLARAVYFEARGEPIEGQLAVAQVIMNRVASGRFADTICGVIAQHGQFSFDHSRTPVDSHDWRTAKAIAAIAATATWDAVTPRATAFHATRINATWSSMHKVGTIGNHVFYR